MPYFRSSLAQRLEGGVKEMRDDCDLACATASLLMATRHNWDNIKFLYMALLRVFALVSLLQVIVSAEKDAVALAVDPLKAENPQTNAVAATTPGESTLFQTRLVLFAEKLSLAGTLPDRPTLLRT